MSKKVWTAAALFSLLAFLPFFNQKTPPLQPDEKINQPNNEPYFEPLTLEKVFSSDHRLPDGINQDEVRTLIITGDVIPARGVNIETLKRGDFTYPWQEVKYLLKRGDLRIINLEAPLLKNCPVLDSGFTFCGDARHIEGLKFAGIEMVGLENNHIANFGFEGLRETQNLLSQNNIEWARRDKLAIKEVRGVKFGLLAFNGIGERVDREAMAEEIREARTQVDILMTMFHWGKEYERLPKTDGTIAPDDPRELAHLAVDSGVDLVIGNHQHWVQGIEFYKGSFIPYAHGNFIFDQMWSEETRLGVVGKYTFYGRELVDVQFLPIKIFNFAQPRPLSGEEAQLVLDKMRLGSEELAHLDR